MMSKENHIVTHICFSDESWKNYYRDIFGKGMESLKHLCQYVNYEEAQHDLARIALVVKTFGWLLHQQESIVIDPQRSDG